jgi:glycogen operon protein
VEGPTDDPAILAARAQQRRNFMATLLLSQGVPMMCAGDEVGRTQHGNNNAYCQDNDLSWMQWDDRPVDGHFLAFTRMLIGLRQKHQVLRRRRFFQGRPLRGHDVKDLVWLDGSGHEMSDEMWGGQQVRCLGMLLSGIGIDETTARGEPISDDTLLILLNGDDSSTAFQLPTLPSGATWSLVFDTAHPMRTTSRSLPHRTYDLHARSMVLLKADERSSLSIQ